MSKLFSPIRLGPLELANRIAIAPMCQYSAEQGFATDWHMIHLGHLALSGAGLLIIEATAVTEEGRITYADLGLWSDEHAAALEPVVNAMRRHAPIKIAIQLAHAGRKASSEVPWQGGANIPAGHANGWQTVAPSALPHAEGETVPLALDAAGLQRVKDGFVAAARRADALGLDAIELHGAHGYLLHSFVSPISNKRTDDYGGMLAARMRYPLEVARAVRAVVPKPIPLGARITGSDWMDGGLTPDDAVTFAKALKAVGLDFVCTSSGGVSAETRPTAVANTNGVFAERVKREAGIATRTVGLIATPKQAEAIVAEGKADMVALARAFLDNPHWGWHAALALGADVARPKQYLRAAPKTWPGAAYRDQ
jgi:2,4-dienoyl-CoA reductase-like NADH-dependent reductase (Old Yellow Enzyme family)